MEDGFIPCDAYVLAPFGAFAGLLLGMPVLAITLAANSVWPDAMSKALQLISESQRIGPFAKVLLQIIVPLLWLVLLPPAAALSGLAMGVYYGVSTGWRLFAGGVDCVKEMITEPSDLWRSTVLDPVRDKLAEVIKSEQDLEKSGWKPEVQIDVNPLLLTTACAMGLIGGIVTSILYAFQGLWFMFPMAYRLYQTNLKLCKSEFIIVEAIFALVAYLAQVFLIPFYVIVFTLIQPIIGFAMGFGQIAYSVLLYSNKDHSNPCAPLLNTFGFSGLVPAAGKLVENVQARWKERNKPVLKCMDRMYDAQEKSLHCWRTTANSSRWSTLRERARSGVESLRSRVSSFASSAGDQHSNYQRLSEAGDIESGSKSPPSGAAKAAAVLSKAVAAHDVEGTLRIYLKEGVDLKAADSNGKSDPYVKASCGGKELKSKVIKKDLNPKWYEALDFSGKLSEFLLTDLTLRVFDQDWMSKDDPLGDATVSLQQLRTAVRTADHPLSMEADLSLKGTQKGKVLLDISWYPNTR